MDTNFFKADIFFVVTTVAVVVISIGIIIALVYTIRILRDIKNLSEKAKSEGERILQEVKYFRENISEKSSFMSSMLSNLLSFGLKRVTKSRPLGKKKDIDV
ncbi:hypothetical protein H0W91_01350 [Patescibacteria group bacterium]|nr:hypothetical protein [Patescibacteria group bacterium]